MRRHHSASALAIACLCAALSRGAHIPALGSATAWQGRVVPAAPPAPPGSATFDWPGVRVRFTAPANTTSVTATLLLPPPLVARLRVYIDGVAATAQPLDVAASATPQTLTLAAGLDGSRAHELALESVLEPALQHPQPFLPAPPYAALQLHSLELVGAAAAAPAPPPRARSIVVVGDSISAGFGAGGGGGDCPQPGVYSEDSSLTYGALLCAQLGADCSTVAYSGKGIFENSPTAGTNETMPQYYFSALGAGRAPFAHDWDFQAAPKPSLVLVNLGTNDFGHGHDTGPTWEAKFSAAYVAFFRQLAALHGDARLPIFAGCGPLTSRPVPAIRAAVAACSAAGGNCFFLDLGLVNATGCFGHPGARDHAAVAALARPQIMAAMGWQ